MFITRIRLASEYKNIDEKDEMNWLELESKRANPELAYYGIPAKWEKQLSLPLQCSSVKSE